jgi:uncharacterized lipoprotein YmbA
VEIPEYLDRPQIIIRAEDHVIRLAEFDRWAEPLKENLTRVLAENLSSLLATDRIALFPWKGSKPMDYRIVVNVLRFEGAWGDDFILEARWTLFSLQEDKEPLMRKSRLQAALGEKEDFKSLAAAGSRLLADLCKEMAEAIWAETRKRSD